MNSHNTQGPTTLFRIFVEDTGARDELTELVSKAFPLGITIHYGYGLWEGQSEQTAIIELYGPESLRGSVTALAHTLKEVFNQKVVAVAEHNDRVQFYYV